MPKRKKTKMIPYASFVQRYNAEAKLKEGDIVKFKLAKEPTEDEVNGISWYVKTKILKIQTERKKNK